MIKVKHYRDRCIGCYYCVEVAPQRWVMNEDDGKADLIDGIEKKNYFEAIIFDSSELQSILEAEKLCPSNVIKIEI